MQQIPVYAFTGFLDSGKTKFIQETLEDPRFNAGERTLLLVFEEGEEEYDFSSYPHENVYLYVLNQETVTAKELQADENIKDILVKQVANSIYMEKTIEYLEAKGVDTVIEIGPGKALSGFVKRTSDNLTAYAVENIEDINKVIEMFGR